MLRTDPRNRARTTRAKAKVNHPRVGDTSELLASEGRERVSFATSLGIVRGGRDPRDTTVPIISGTHKDTVRSSLPQFQGAIQALTNLQTGHMD